MSLARLTELSIKRAFECAFAQQRRFPASDARLTSLNARSSLSTPLIPLIGRNKESGAAPPIYLIAVF